MKQLDVFDFDGTLFHSPENTPENQKKFEEHTGLPWIINKKMAQELTQKLGRKVFTRNGWWGKGETLQPPFVPSPVPKDMFIDKVCQDLMDSQNNPDVITIMMTGRHVGIKQSVIRILTEAELLGENLICWFCGDNGPSPFGDKPNQTLPWKMWILEQYVNLYPIDQIKIWEDRKEHVEKFRELELVPEIIVNHVFKNGDYETTLTENL